MIQLFRAPSCGLFCFFAIAIFSAIVVVKFIEDFEVVLPALMLGHLSSMCFLGLLAVLCKQLIG